MNNLCSVAVLKKKTPTALPWEDRGALHGPGLEDLLCIWCCLGAVLEKGCSTLPVELEVTVQGGLGNLD